MYRITYIYIYIQKYKYNAVTKQFSLSQSIYIYIYVYTRKLSPPKAGPERNVPPQLGFLNTTSAAPLECLNIDLAVSLKCISTTLGVTLFLNTNGIQTDQMDAKKAIWRASRFPGLRRCLC